MTIPEALRNAADLIDSLPEHDHESVLSELRETLQAEIWRLSNINFDYEESPDERRANLRNDKDDEQYHRRLNDD